MSTNDQVSEQNTPRFTSKDLEAVKISEEEQQRFKDWVVRNKGLSEREKAALEVDSVPAFRDCWQHMNSARESFDRSHERGCGLLGRRYQSSAAFVLPFMEQFSPIVQIVKDFGAPYGGIAVGTVSIFFVVAANKNELEKSLGLAISSIRDRLPGLDLYRNIYNEKHELDKALQNRIVMAYQCIMGFCIQATKYYTEGGRRRWLRAFLPAEHFADKVQEVQDHILEIRRLCEELLNKNVDIIKRSNEKLREDNTELKAQTIQLKAQITGLKEQITEVQNEHDHDRLNEVQLSLGLDGFSEEKHREEWNQHAQFVKTDEELNTEILQQMSGPVLDMFRAGETYQRWRHSAQSCLLILSGYNDISIDQAHQCWISPIATATIEEFSLDDPRSFYAYYALSRNGKLLYDVCSVILLQLLRQKSSALRNEQRYMELRTELRKFHNTGLDESGKVSMMEKIAVRVIDLFDESETLYVIVDRADRCGDPMTAYHRKSLLRVFVKMVEAARCRLRILTVINARSWPVENYRDELGAKMMERVIFCNVKQQLRG